ncbi:hypothetical protein Poly59_30730 [Rubripirellula reticaptiva]|uniref:Uncharacterized protein n=1 Tax=Rubripirellula reticaptiva TaxID=2528013 RepID=A0A5C6EW73_9BACT|nr:hypothetical protein Poly59_30730 [Rubripirellula reticaptiva]
MTVPDANPYAATARTPSQSHRSESPFFWLAAVGFATALLVAAPGALLWLHELLASQARVGIYDVELLGFSVDPPTVIRWSFGFASVAAFVSASLVVIGIRRSRAGTEARS